VAVIASPTDVLNYSARGNRVFITTDLKIWKTAPLHLRRNQGKHQNSPYSCLLKHHKNM